MSLRFPKAPESPVQVLAVLWLAALLIAPAARAAYPPPPNDTPATAVPVVALPAVLTGSNVAGNDTISATTLPGLTAVPGPDVFYTFTPPANGSYWLVLIPWVQVPVYASSGGSVPVPDLCLYVRDVGTGVFVAGNDTNPVGQTDTVIASLTGGTTYELVVDSTETVPRGQQFEFTLMVTAAPSGSADNCASGAVISNLLPTAVVGTLTGAVDDFTFIEGSGRCDVADPSGTFIAGPDHVYEFTTGEDPADAGDYVFDLLPGGMAWDGYLYVADSCPPFLPLGCLGAASHTSNTTRQSEAVVVTLEEGKTYYVYVDAAAFALPDAKYALLVSRAEDYEINEIEPNETPASASALVTNPDGAQVVGSGDVDHWSFAAGTGDRLFAFLDNGNAALSDIDGELRVLDRDGSTIVEFDDDDGEGAVSSIASLTLRSSAFSACVAGTPLYEAGTYFLQTNASGSTSTIARYRLHYGLEPGTRLPAPECEPNGSAGYAEASAKEYHGGAISAEGDTDWYTFATSAGTRIFIALDGDPERNSGGSDPASPLALDGALRVLDPAGDPLFDDVDDKSGVGSGQIPDYPAEALCFVAPVAGTYTVIVSGGDLSDYGPQRTYALAIFQDNAAPDLADEVDPVIDSITPNFGGDTLAVTASDDAAGDSGLCGVSLAAASENLQILNLSLTPGDPQTSFDVGLIDANTSGAGKLIITDCAGNTTCALVEIDAEAPDCTGAAVTPTRRAFASTHDPIHVPNNQPSGPGIFGDIAINTNGTIADVNVTITIETISPPDIDVYLESPAGTRVELITDRGSSSAFDITAATFDDSASALMPTTSSAAPYTGVWKPEDPLGLARLNGENIFGTWRLNVIDDSSTAGGGARLVRWSLDLDAGFGSPQYFAGSADDFGGTNAGLTSIELTAGANVALNLPADFGPGDLTVDYTVTLLNPSTNGWGTVTVTDLSNNTCTSAVSLLGLADATGPVVDGETTRDFRVGAEVQASVPVAPAAGVISTAGAPADVAVGEVEVDLTIDTLEVGRLAATLTHAGEFTALLNRTGMTERGSVGLTKDNIEINLDDDAPVADDTHLEPALGTIEFLGLHQPDGRGAFIGDGISSDYRDNMLFALEGLDSAGDWELFVGDYRVQGAGSQRATFRRWSALVKSPGGPERYFGVARDTYPQAGICSVALAGGATNLVVTADFVPGAHEVTYMVAPIDPDQPGSGTLHIADCAGNVTAVPISLQAALTDQTLPAVSGTLNHATQQYEGLATETAPGDSGIVSVQLAPYANNLQLVSVNPNPPGGADTVDFVVGLITPGQNGRGYVRVTDAVGYRRHVLVAIDAAGPVCTGSVERTKRYVSTDTPLAIPDNNVGGVYSQIIVPDLDEIEDVNLTVNIVHPMDDDIDADLTTPLNISLFSDIGGTGNDFIDSTLDDEAAGPMPDSAASAPFTGSYQLEPPALLSLLDGNIATGIYTLKIADDAVYNTGYLAGWSVTIASSTFPQRFDGRAEDSESYSTGLCAIELLPGASGLTLVVDDFTPGDELVRYSVVMTNRAVHGRGTVQISDCAGNVCTVPICLTADYPPADKGDLNGDDTVNLADYALFADCLDGPTQAGFECGDLCELADYDGDGDVDLLDFADLQAGFEAP